MAKEITWVLMGKLRDPETGREVYVTGMTLKGTPLQVATAFEALREVSPGVDLSVNDDSDAEIYKIGEETLKSVRGDPSDAYVYDDPDKSQAESEKERLDSCLNH